MDNSKMTPAMQDYLEAIYLIEQKNRVSRVSEIGREMKVKKASVVAAVRYLMKRGMLTHQRYGFIMLTETGKAEAENIRKKNAVIMDFLENILKVSHDTAEQEACGAEHIFGNQTIEKLASHIRSVKKDSRTVQKIRNKKRR